MQDIQVSNDDDPLLDYALWFSKHLSNWDMEMVSSYENEDGPWEYGMDEEISSPL